MSNEKLSHFAPCPRSSRTKPRYPRQLVVMGAALSMAACMGAAPAPYEAASPAQTVAVEAPPPAASNTFAVPPDEEVPPSVEPEPEEVPLAGVAPQPFE